MNQGSDARQEPLAIRSRSRQVKPEHYDFSKYVTEERWICFWHQIDEVLSVRPDDVLEVGVGLGVVGMVLKRAGVSYQSVDIDEELCPDFVASVLDLPFADNSFDAVACYQVLEHLEYEEFIPALREVARVSRSLVVLSLPDARPQWCFSVHLPRLGDIRFRMPRPRLNAPRHSFLGEHYWEIGKRGYDLSRVCRDIEEAGLLVQATYRLFEYPYWRFFRLIKP